MSQVKDRDAYAGEGDQANDHPSKSGLVNPQDANLAYGNSPVIDTAEELRMAGKYPSLRCINLQLSS